PAAGEVIAAARAAGRQGGGGGGRGLALGSRPGTAGEGPADGAHAQAFVRTRAVRAGIAAAGVTVVAVGVARARGPGRQSGRGRGGRPALGGRPGTAGEGPADGAHAQAFVRTRAVRAGIVAARVAIVAVGVARARGPGRQSGRGRGGRPALGGRPGTASEGPADGAHAQALVRTRAVRAGIAAAGVTVVAVGVARARGGVEALRAAEGAGQRAGLVRRAGDVRAGEADRIEALAAPHGGRALERA